MQSVASGRGCETRCVGRAVTADRVPDARPFTGLRVLGITPTPTHPATAGNRVRCKALLDRLEALGATVRLVHIAHEPGDDAAMRLHWSRGGFVSVPFRQPRPRYARLNRALRALRRITGITIQERRDVDDWCDPATAPAIHHEVETFQPHAIVMVYIWNSALLEGLPRDVVRVLDAQDVFTNRDERMRAAGVAQNWFSVSAVEEARGVSRFDVVLAIQEQEAGHYRAMTAGKVVTVGHFLPEFDTGPVSRHACLLIVASDNAVNVDGVQWFLREVWPLVHAARPDAEVRIAGRVCQLLTPAPGVSLLGAVDDLVPLYTQSRIVVNPLRGGTGLKIKGAEALAAGRPVLSTPSAAEGLESAVGSGLVIAHDAASMASAAVSLLHDDGEAERLGAAARQFAARWNRLQHAAFDEVFTAIDPSARAWPPPPHTSRTPA